MTTYPLNALDNGITPSNQPDKNYENYLRLTRQIERLQLYFPAQDAPYRFDTALRLKSYYEITGDGEYSELLNVSEEGQTAQHKNNVLLLGTLASPDPVRLQLARAFVKVSVEQGMQTLQVEGTWGKGDALVFISDEFVQQMQGDKLFPVDPEFFEIHFVRDVEGTTVTLEHPLSRTCENCLVANITQTKIEKLPYPGLDTNPIEVVRSVTISKLKLTCKAEVGIPLHPMGVYECMFSDLWLYGDSLIYGNAISYSTFQNIQGTFHDKAVDIALGSVNVVVKNLNAVASGMYNSKPKRIFNTGQASKDVFMENSFIDARAREGAALFGVGADNVVIRNTKALGGRYPSAIVAPSSPCPNYATFEDCEFTLQPGSTLVTALDQGEKYPSNTTLKNCRLTTLEDADSLGAESVGQRGGQARDLGNGRESTRATQRGVAQRGRNPNRPNQRDNRERPTRPGRLIERGRVAREERPNRVMGRENRERPARPDRALERNERVEGNTRVTGRNQVNIL